MSSAISASTNTNEYPGTILLTEKHGNRDEVVLNPVPSSDPNDPLNWSRLRKIVNFALSLSFAFVAFVLMGSITVSLNGYTRDLGLTQQGYNNSVAANFTGLAVGSLFFVPFVHRYGRRPIYIASSVVQLAIAIWSANMKTANEVIASNLLMGLGGAVSETIVVLTIGDLFFVHQHALMNGIFLLAQGVGVSLGPLALGYLIEATDWRFSWWIQTALVGTNLSLVICFFEETKYTPHFTGHPTSFVNSEQDPSKNDAEKEGVGAVEIGRIESTAYDIPMRSVRQRLALLTPTDEPVLRHLYQPFVLLATFPGVLYPALTYGCGLGILSLMASTQAFYVIQPPYNMNPSQVGLLGLPVFVGSLISTVVFSPISDKSIIWLGRRNRGIFEPEMRIWPAFLGAVLILAGLLAFGFLLDERARVILLNVSYAIYTTGFVLTSDIALTYMLDCYPEVLGDAMVAVVFVRNAFSVVIMFSGTPWIQNLGIRNGFILAAAISFVLLMIPVPMMIWGKALRRHTAQRYRKFSARQAGKR